ncbi:efflux RND transporter periplasmic adaptor subunit [Brevibacillus nitrificans]|uniref:efflux RND transporter periplasmic adaptor subunit n=1 Tax=Brevibacillus nitrificans TaxID=651560 RepID=UPI00261FAF86|nr:efflux RND transporter periplasmic adaptor subunit [Brevibacillus nitrificans]
MTQTDKKRTFFSKGRTNKKRWIIVGLAVVLIGGGVYGYQSLSTPSRAQAAFQVVNVQRGDVSETVLASGAVQASKRTSLSFSDAEDAKDAISSIKVGVGDQVKAGQVLATMDDSVAQIQVTNAQANLLSAQAKLEEAQKRKTSAEMKTLLAAVNQAKIELDQAKQSIDSQKATNDEAKAKAALQNAQKTYASQKALYEAGAISKTEYDAAQTDLDSAQRDYNTAVLTASQTKGQSGSKIEQAQAAYDTAVEAVNEANEGPDASTVLSAKAAVEQAKAQLQQAQKALNAVTLKAPMDGVIVQLNGNVGEIPGSDFIIMDNSNSGNLEVMAQISQSDIGKVKEGLKVNFTTSSYPDETFTGSVKLVYPEAKTESGVTTYDVLLSVANKDGMLKIGMNMNVSIEIGTHQNVLVVPAQALQTLNGKDGVYLYTAGNTASTENAENTDNARGKGGTENASNTRSGGNGGNAGNGARQYRFQPVKIGYFASDRVEITEGLSEGDKVVILANTATSSSTNQNSSRMGGFGGGMGGFGGGMGGGFPSGGGGGMRGR